jgi:UDP-glucuronate 4-epimerase
MHIDLSNKTILITGAAGFVGAYLVQRVADEHINAKIIGVDNLNTYYDVSLKEYRLSLLESKANFTFVKSDIADRFMMEQVFTEYNPSVVVNLAAQAGVRYSITNPEAYMNSNITGFFNILELCRRYPVEHLVYASSSSVYGMNEKIPYSVLDKTDNPVSLYAATKKSNELMAHVYSHLYNIPTTGLRFFTVYGPAGRPDMAYFSFTNKICKGEKIQLFNCGDMKRDFTYIHDIVTGVLNVMQRSPEAKFAVYNIGNNSPVKLIDFVDILEECLLREGIITSQVERELLPMQLGDVYQTYADVDDLQRDFSFKPSTSLEDGLGKFAKWYKAYYIDNERNKKWTLNM